MAPRKQFTVTPFSTKRLFICPWAICDLKPLFEIVSDPEVMKYVNEGRPLTTKEVTAWIEKSIRNYSDFGYGRMAIVEQSTQQVIGYGGVAQTKPKFNEIIYGFKKAFWGQGYGKEVALAFIRRAKSTWGLETLYATIDPMNLRSIRILESLGMKHIKEQTDEYGLPERFFAVHFAGANNLIEHDEDDHTPLHKGDST